MIKLGQFLTIFTILLFSNCLNAQQAYLDAVIEKWENSKKLTLEYLDLMPEDKLDFQPDAESMSFKRELIHIMQNMLWLSKDYLGHDGFESDLKTANPNKEELRDILNNAFDHALNALKTVKPHDLNLKVAFFAGEKNLYQIVNLMHDHLTHHRGQLAVYLRLNGIKPPRYVGW